MLFRLCLVSGLILCSAGCKGKGSGEDWVSVSPFDYPKERYREAKIFTVQQNSVDEAVQALRYEKPMVDSCARMSRYSDSLRSIAGMCSLVRSVDCGGELEAGWIGDTLELVDWKLGKAAKPEKRPVIAVGQALQSYSYCAGAE